MSPDFRQLNFFSKTLLKISDKEGYKEYKKNLNNIKFELEYQSKLKGFKQDPLLLDKILKREIKNVKHSGNAGDIIYSLPFVKSFPIILLLIFFWN